MHNTATVHVSDLSPIADDQPVPPPPLKGVAKQYLVGVLYYGAVDREHERCIRALKEHPYVGQVLELTGCPYIDMGRSLIATVVLDNPDIGGLLFIDHDMVFDVVEAQKLIESCEEHQSVVGAAYSMRRSGKIIGGIAAEKLAPGEQIVFFEGGKVVPASHLGMGLTAIHRTVLERLVAHADGVHAKNQALHDETLSRVETGPVEPLPMPPHDLPRMLTGISESPVVPFFSHRQQKGIYYGEDVSFCLRCEEAGIPVQLDTRIRVYHKGSYCYGLEDVSMEVPFLTSLVAIDSPSPKVQPAPPNLLVQAALDAGAAAPGVETAQSEAAEQSEAAAQ